jgi:hypothetical protein
MILYFGNLSGGTEQTQLHCIRRQKPYILIDGREVPVPTAIELGLEFIQGENVEILNVAGPRRSRWSGGQDYAREVLSGIIQAIRKESEADKT